MTHEATTHDTLLRLDLLDLKMWIEHWDRDREVGLPPTEQSMARVKQVLDRAIKVTEGCHDH